MAFMTLESNAALSRYVVEKIVLAAISASMRCRSIVKSGSLMAPFEQSAPATSTGRPCCARMHWARQRQVLHNGANSIPNRQMSANASPLVETLTEINIVDLLDSTGLLR